MKGYSNFKPMFTPPFLESEELKPTAKMLGSSIADGRYNGVADGSAGLLVNQYDNDNSMSVDPLCDLSTDVLSLRPNSSTPSSTSSVESSTQE